MQNNNMNNQGYNELDTQVKKIEETTKRKGLKTLKKELKYIGKKAGKILLKILYKILMTLIPYLGTILLLTFIFFIGYFAYFEVRGTQQRYANTSVYENKNEMVDDKNIVYEKTFQYSKENKMVQVFYKYFSTRSFYKLYNKDKKLISLDSDKKKFEELEDYYKKEYQYYLHYDFLYALDEIIFRGKMRYPEQFIKPVYYDENKLELKQLTDNKKKIIAQSTEYNKDGQATGKKVTGIWDYGFAPILHYKDSQITRTIEGVYYEEDYWDGKKVSRRKINIPFKETLPGYPQKIYLIDKAITFVGTFEYIYKNEKTVAGDLIDGVGEKNEPKVKVKYGEYVEYEYVPIYETRKEDVYEERPVYETKIDYMFGIIPTPVKVQTGTKKVKVGEREVKVQVGTEKKVKAVHPLYRYRKGYIYETKPVEEDVNVNLVGDRYFTDYLYNFKIYIPKNVMTEFDFKKRTGQDWEQLELQYSGTVDYGNFVVGGSTTKNDNFKRAMQYFDIVKMYCDTYGISDPYIVIAMIAQESGGNPNIKDGLMQVTYAPGTKLCGYRKDGTKECIVVTEEGKKDPMQNIKMGIFVLQNKLQQPLINGDYIKAIFTYNLGYGGLTYIANKYPESLKSSEWLNYREESRAYWGRKQFGTDTCSADDSACRATKKPIYGDTHYIEHVMRYYAGNGDYKNILSVVGSNVTTAKSGSLLGKLWEEFKEGFVNLFHSDYKNEPMKEFKNELTYEEVNKIIGLTRSMQNQTLFSTNYDLEADFWSEEYGFIFLNGSKIGEGGNGTGLSSEEMINVALDGYISPLNITNPVVTSEYGYRIHPVKKQVLFHKGIDIGIPTGTPLYAVNDGRVIKAQKTDNGGCGLYVTIQHDDGNMSRYCHMSKVSVDEGQKVKKGDFIGYSGNSGTSTGPHLHFEFYINGKTVNPKNLFFNNK